MAEDWTRFDYYASRIRTFIPDLFDSHGLPHHALDVLDTLSSVRGGPIVPNLQSVIFLWSSASVVDALRCIRAIAPATLREVRLSPDASISGPNVPLSLPEFALSYPSVQKAASMSTTDVSDSVQLVMLWLDGTSYTRWTCLSRPPRHG